MPPSDEHLRTQRIFCVIPYYDGETFLPALIASLEASTLRPTAVVLVDNSPLQTRLDEDHPVLQGSTLDVTVVQTAPRIGFARACNIGALHSLHRGATHVCLVNQDATVAPDMLRELAFHHLAESPALSAPLQLQPETGELSPFVARLYVPEALKGKRVLPIATLPQTPRESTTPLSGACLFFDASLVTTYGLFDPLYTMYGEDRDLSHRLLAAGEKLLLVRSAKFYHLHSNATATGEKRAQLLTWQAESGAVNYLKTKWNRRVTWRFRVEQLVLYVRVGLVAGHRAAREAVVQREDRIVAKLRDLSRARHGESLLERTLRFAERDGFMEEVLP